MRSSRKVTLGPATGPSTDINVTPLVDVVLVLLIIFMVVTPLLDKSISASIPQVADDDSPGDQLVVNLLANGDILLSSQKIDEAEYVLRLTEEVKKLPNPRDRVIFFRAEDGASYRKLVHLLDGARQAGADTVGLMTDDPNQEKK